MREAIHNSGLAREELGAAMNIERASTASSLIDVLDRVLDKGIVIDAWVRVSVIGIDLITVEARVVVASFETYLKYADAFVHRGPRSMRSVVVHGGAHGEVTHSRSQVTRRAR
jgi:gas vesicle structural protein